jgi:hypothetical protein
MRQLVPCSAIAGGSCMTQIDQLAGRSAVHSNAAGRSRVEALELATRHSVETAFLPRSGTGA